MSVDKSFIPDNKIKKLFKDVGISQYKDGVRINKAFHNIFNAPTSKNYVKRGQKREVKILFNDNIFNADYQFEGQKNTSRVLQRIQFKKELKNEFKKVFPKPKGKFIIQQGIDDNHFIFSKLQKINAEDEEDYAKSIIEEEFEGLTDKQIEDRLESRIKHYKIKSRKSRRSGTTVISGDPVLKERIKQLYRYTCQLCGTQIKKIGWSPNLKKIDEVEFLTADAHHVVPLAEGGDDEPSNLICVCPNCHRRLHSGEYRILFMGKKPYYQNSITEESFIITLHNIHQLKSH